MQGDLKLRFYLARNEDKSQIFAFFILWIRVSVHPSLKKSVPLTHCNIAENMESIVRARANT